MGCDRTVSVDTGSPLHHGACLNRLTITLDDDLYAMARAHAIAGRMSLSKAIADLLRRRQEVGTGSNRDGGGLRIHPQSGFPVSESAGRPVTAEDVRRAEEDEDLRHLEIMGLSPKEIQRALER